MWRFNNQRVKTLQIIYKVLYKIIRLDVFTLGL